MVTHHRVITCCGIWLSLAGCDSDADKVVPADSPQPALLAPKPVDRLAPGELAEGKSEVFGLAIPRGMQLDAHFGDTAHLSGSVSPEGLANYIRSRVAARRVEIGAGKTIFPRAIIKNGDPDRHVRIEIIPDAAGSVQVRLEDLTPPPTTRGLSEAERWRRAGMTPTGEVLNPKQLE